MCYAWGGAVVLWRANYSPCFSCSPLILTLTATVNGGRVSDPGLNLSFSLINVGEIVKIVRIVNEEVFYKFYKFLPCF